MKLNWIAMIAMLFFGAIIVPSVSIGFGRTGSNGIVYAQGSVPLSGAIVVATGSNGSGYAVTDSSGKYSMADGLGTGDYTLTVMSTSGYLDSTVNKVSVVTGKETSGVNVFLHRSGAITGKVTGPSGNPLKGIIVYATQTSGSGSNSSSYALTAADGTYTINSGLSIGKYNVTAGLGIGTPGETLGYMSKILSGINVLGVQTVPNVNFQLDVSGLISGKVTTNTGIPLANIVVTAASSDYKYYGTTTTNSTGYYKIANGLGTGTYTVMAIKGIIPTMVPNISVTAGQETPNVNIQITITPSGSLTGRVTDTSGNPINAASVSASGTAGTGTAKTDSNGYYTISEGLGTGSYTVSASATGYVSSTPKTASVTVNQVTPNINFQLQKVSGTSSGKISGTVTGEPNPIPEFPVDIAPVAFSVAALVALITSIKTRHKKKEQNK